MAYRLPSGICLSCSSGIRPIVIRSGRRLVS